MFAAVAAGNPLQLSSEVADSNGLQHTIALSSTKSRACSHITLFILPNVTFPENFIATVYFKLAANAEFQLFGYLSLEKPSAIFKVRLPGSSAPQPGDGLGEIDMDEDGDSGPGDKALVTIGISIEPREAGLQKVQAWRAERASAASRNTSTLVLSRPAGPAIATAGQLAKAYPLLTRDLAAKIVQHAYNYLSGFLDANGNVSIKRFDTWWDKFRNRLENDGTFLDEISGA
ncbi:Opi10 protein [Maudiozyma humilis]|uniref:Opi10 protein n=1 Tax=Maudiozyma humilis TaxID=51915 RepID=A0AAV5RYJ8_MAUHU|nr:Opi10 protein [Kazachstania humilis]